MGAALSAIDISVLTKRPIPEYEEKVRAKIEEGLAAARKEFPQTEFTFPELLWTLEGRVAGWAMGVHTINLNLKLMYENWDNFISDTVPHELAHCITAQIWPRQHNKRPHGAEWGYVMNHVMKLPAKRCHNYDAAPAKVHKRKWGYWCDGCKDYHWVTTRMHNKWQDEQQTRICKQTRVRIPYTNFEAERED